MKTQETTPAKVVPIVTSIKPNDFFEEMFDWSDRVAQRAFEIFRNNGFLHGRDLDDWLAAERELLKPVALDIKDTKENFLVTAEVPGFEPKDLDIQVEGARLVIKGKQEALREEKDKEGKIIHSERKANEICRVIDLPAPVLAENAVAEVKNGVLKLTLPKAQKATTVKIQAA